MLYLKIINAIFWIAEYFTKDNYIWNKIQNALCFDVE